MFIARELYEFLLKVIEETRNSKVVVRTSQIANGEFDETIQAEVERAFGRKLWLNENYPNDQSYTRPGESSNGTEGMAYVCEEEGVNTVSPFDDARSDTDQRFALVLVLEDPDDWLAKAYEIADKARTEYELYHSTALERDTYIKNEEGFKSGFMAALYESTSSLAEKSSQLKRLQAELSKMKEALTGDQLADQSNSQKILEKQSLRIQELEVQILELTQVPDSNKDKDPLEMAFANVRSYFISTPKDIIDTISNAKGTIGMTRLHKYEAKLILNGLKHHFKLFKKNAKNIQIKIADDEECPWLGRTGSIDSNSGTDSSTNSLKYKTIGEHLFASLQLHQIAKNSLQIISGN